MMGTPQIFNYGKEAITFTDARGNVFVNATEMAKPFGKRPVDWLRIDQAKQFLIALEEHHEQKCGADLHHTFGNSDDDELNFFKIELVKVQQRGVNAGTWFHEDVALEFARWLSPAFAIWCNDRVKEILLNQAREAIYEANKPTEEDVYKYLSQNYTIKFVNKEHEAHVSRVRAEAGRKGGKRSAEVRSKSNRKLFDDDIA